jgi:hypothetical protein
MLWTGPRFFGVLVRYHGPSSIPHGERDLVIPVSHARPGGGLSQGPAGDGRLRSQRLSTAVGAGTRFPDGKRRIQQGINGRFAMKNRIIIASCAATFLLLSGCGVAETASVAATEANAAAEQVKEGKKLEQKVQDDMAAADQVAKEARDAAEAASQ